VALTGYGLPEDRARALDAGFDAHIVKPVDLDKLRSIVSDIRPTGIINSPLNQVFRQS
jgi:CheY-like chemotaxis protein